MRNLSLVFLLFLFVGCATTTESSLEARIYEANQYTIVSLEAATQILVKLEQQKVTLSEIQAKALLGLTFGLTELHESLNELMIECELSVDLESCSETDYINQAITTTTDLARLVLLISQEAK